MLRLQNKKKISGISEHIPAYRKGRLLGSASDCLLAYRRTLQRRTPWRSAQTSAGRPVLSTHRTVSLCIGKCDDTDVHNYRTAFLPYACVHITASCAGTSHLTSQNSDTKYVKIQTEIH